ncbi:MAG: LamG-like jellyroll fold domain-containing protein [Caldilineaceae bacterium]
MPNFAGWGDSYIRGATAVNDGNWHHVLVTWDYSGSGTAGTGKLYVDGVDDTASTTNYQAQNADNAGDTLKIGRPNFGTEAPHFFAGLLDEVIVYDRALADYEAANLYAYGHVTWETATVDNGAWSYTIPEGENGVEGFYQLNVRGTDALGNATPLSGQRGWRGEIDTKPPSVEFVVTTNDSGSTPTTKYECIATDFNLLQESDRQRLPDQ